MRKLFLSLLAVMLAMSTSGFAFASDKASQKGASATIVIHASQEEVWKTICDTASFEESIRSVKGNQAVVEQKFKSLPIFGTTTAIVKTTVFPKDRIEYELLQSDRLKDLNGTWTLTPVNKQKTKLELSSYVDPGLPIPRFLINAFTTGKCRSRLKKIKTLAEKAHVAEDRPNHTASKN